ncbi:MAG TPA: phenylalanine--tRNA ligase subunit beta [Gammaproteobacteria bacterium]|nr:phenylalanine--tRNA ligase subunit beta [Gammaproteobacteria bacterium]
MRLSERWLREWVNPELSREDLCENLTMAGLEIEEVVPVAEKFSGVVVGKVLRVEKHPAADRLQVCEVNAGGPETLSIVCGAKNVKPEMMTAVALVGALLPDNTKIKAGKLRGVFSHGMLCSASELGLAGEDSEGLIVLPPDAPIGRDVWDYLDLTDHILDVSITPNRGDCLSILGLAQDVSAITQTTARIPGISKIDAKISDNLSIQLDASEECPHYVGRVIRNVAADAMTPVWMQERLRRGGVRCISPIVDIMNYVMLELGQPMHAFDLEKISDGIHVRMAKVDESLELLNGEKVTLDSSTLIIADTEKPLAIAGVMGGMESGVTLLTQNIFLESAFFQPMCVARTSRHYKLNSESSYRFERGVDPALQVNAIERATRLILEIAGGTPGPVIDKINEKYLPQKKIITLRSDRIHKILGINFNEHQIEKILQSLGFMTEKSQEGWNVTVPARRFDITVEIDLIEEIIRIYGYDKVPEHLPVSGMQMNPFSEKKISLSVIRHLFCDKGYQEIIAYSFIDKKIQQLFDPDIQAKELLNPITTEMSVMRTSLWPGLINTLIYNQNRQQERAKIFETGLRYIVKNDVLRQQNVLSGLVCGNVFPEQWGVPARTADFYDVKGDIEHLLNLTSDMKLVEFKPAHHPALHPGQNADIYRDGMYLGVLGVLHPRLAQELSLSGTVILFELLLEGLEPAKLPHFQEISRFPEIRRDIAILVDQAVPIRLIQDTITHVAGGLLQALNIFDVYQGKGVKEGHKSVALSLTLQHSSRTLVDEEVAALMEQIIVTLKEQFAAELRG